MPPESRLSGNASLDLLTVGPGPLHRRYLGAATALFPGLEALADSTLSREDAYVLVAGFVAEATLKALIAHNRFLAGHTEGDPIRGHDLAALSQQATLHKANVLTLVPAWMSALNEFHDKPYFIRYKEAGGFYSLPAKAELHRELVALHALVKQALA
jgi:hypothetical protein